MPERRSPALVIWVLAQTGLAQCQRALGHNAEARRVAEDALAICEELGIGPHSYELVRTLALAEASDGEFARAAERLDRIIAKQTALGATGLRLGMSYEARALVAIWSGDVAAYEHYARLTAHEYRYGARSPLSARYERLKLEAGRRGLPRAAELSDFESESSPSGSHDVDSLVALAMTGTQRLEERAQRALQLICDARAARAAHLYLAAQGRYAVARRLVRPCASRQGAAALVREFIERELDEREARTIVVTGVQSRRAAPSAGDRIGRGRGLRASPVDVHRRRRRARRGRDRARARRSPDVNPMQSQLLAALAGHLVEIAEATVNPPTAVERGARARRD